jgi:low affinity Fe/Cu permease
VLGQIDPVLARPFLVGFSEAMQLVFLAGAAVLAVALVVVFFLPEEPLREASALAERMADQARATAGVGRRSDEAVAVTAPSSQAVDAPRVDGGPVG